jgi:hypothetical protein
VERAPSKTKVDMSERVWLCHVLRGKFSAAASRVREGEVGMKIPKNIALLNGSVQ